MKHILRCFFLFIIFSANLQAQYSPPTEKNSNSIHVVSFADSFNDSTQLRLKNPSSARIIGITSFVVLSVPPLTPLGLFVPSIVSIYSEQRATEVLRNFGYRTLVIPATALTSVFILSFLTPKNGLLNISDTSFLIILYGSFAWYLTHGIREIVLSTRSLEQKNKNLLDSVALIGSYEPITKTPLIGLSISLDKRR